VLKRLISRAAIWVGRRRTMPPVVEPAEWRRRGQSADPRLERDIAASLTDETLAWAIGTWRKRYL
jgi:hypothetical protein